MAEEARPPAPRLPRLIVITDARPEDALWDRLIPVLALGSEVAIQLRRPHLAIRAFAEEARRAAERCRTHQNPLFVNGRLEIALRVGAHLHLPAAGLRVEDVRAHLPAGRWLSCAVHSPEEADAAVEADLALVSPVFPPGSKPDDSRPPLGVTGFERLADRLTAPAYALGGIQPENAGTLTRARGFAAISAVLDATDPRAAAEALLRAVHV